MSAALGLLPLLLAQGVLLRDVPYVPNAHHEQHLDFTTPGGTGFATLVFVHGGSLEESGERRDSLPYRGICAPFVRAGIACANVDYRLAPSFSWPAMPHDVAAAVRWVRDAAMERGGDSTRLFLFGHSSGCLLVATIGTDSTYLARVGLRTRDIAGIIPMGCMLSLADTAGRGLSPDQVRAGFARSHDLVAVYASVDNLLEANPIRHAGGHVPPALVVVAEAERFAPPVLEQGAKFVRLLLEAHVPANLIVVPGRHRSSIAGVTDGDATFEAIRRFIADPHGAGQP